MLQVSQDSFGQCHSLIGKKWEWAPLAICGTSSALMQWEDFLGSRTSSIYFRLLRDCSLTFLELPTRSLLRARLQFLICDFLTYRVSADACFLSHGCSSRELQCPRAPR